MNELFWTRIPVLDIPVVVVVGLVGLWLLLRNRATKEASDGGFDAMVGTGQPVVLEFFSNT